MTKLLTALLIAGLSATAKADRRIDTWTVKMQHPTLNSVTKNPSEKILANQTVYKFEIEHGGCGRDGSFNDCKNDRQRIELMGKKYRIMGWSNGGRKTQHYRTKLFFPSEELLPNTQPMKQMIHQVKTYGKLQPIWMVSMWHGGLRIDSDSAGYCDIPEQFVPRGRWLEIEIHADYSIYSKEEAKLAQEAVLMANNPSYEPKIAPSFRYFIDGVEACTMWNPLITKDGMRDANLKQKAIFLKFGIYNTFASRWLLNQSENVRWVQENNVTFASYRQDQKGQRTGAVTSKIGTPFDYDWPVKLPKQTIYYSDWIVEENLTDLPESQFVKSKAEQEPTGCSDPAFALILGEKCG